MILFSCQGALIGQRDKLLTDILNSLRDLSRMSRTLSVRPARSPLPSWRLPRCPLGASPASSEPLGPHVSFPHCCSRKEGFWASDGARMWFIVNVLPPGQAHMVTEEGCSGSVMKRGFWRSSWARWTWSFLGMSSR